MTRNMRSTASRQRKPSKVEASRLFQDYEAASKLWIAIPAIRRAGTLSLAVLVFCLMCVLSTRLTAQSALFLGAQHAFGGWYNPTGVAVDRWGNVYVADSSLATEGNVFKLPAGGGAPIEVGTGLKLPSGVAVDAAGDLFIADPAGQQLVELPADGGAQQTIVSAAWTDAPIAVAIDPSGQVLFVDAANQKVWRILRAEGRLPERFEAVGTGLIEPTGVAVDSAGNVFISDGGLDQVLEVPANGRPEFSIASGLDYPAGVAVDSRGNVFIADSGNINTNGVIEVPPIGSGGAQTTVLRNLQNPAGVAVDSNGNLFVADAYLGALDNAGSVRELQMRSIDFGTVSVCPAAQSTQASCSQALTAQIALFFGVSGTSKALTLGATNQDFAITGTTCGEPSRLPHECIVTVTFSPKRPGLRSGALQITNGDGGPLLLTIPLSGVGSGPLVSFTTSAQSKTKIAASGLDNPTAVATDGNGNVYIVDAYNNRLVKVAANGGAQTTVGTGLANPLGVAVDGAGNIFIADWGNKRVVKVSPQGVQTTVDAGYIGAAGVAVDAVGNVFVSEQPGCRGTSEWSAIDHDWHWFEGAERHRCGRSGAGLHRQRR
jgi:sugar lactone lactonase YvrE